MGNILIVEDEAIIALTLANSLKKIGYNVLAHFSSGEEAIEYLTKLQSENREFPDLILMDIMLMGEMDGTETAEIVKNNFRVPVVYLTAFSNETILAKAKITEPYAYIIKPFNERELQISIEIALYKFKSEQKIKESESKFRNIFNSISSIFYSTNMDGEILMISPSVEKHLGYAQEKLIGTNIGDLFLNRKDANAVLDILAKQGGVYEFEAKLRHQNGSIVDISTDVKYLTNEDGWVTGICGIVKDITYIKKTEQEAYNYLCAIEQSHEIIYITDSAGIIQYVNNKAVEVSRYSRNELIGQSPRLFKSGILHNNFYKKMWEDLLQGKAVEATFPNRTKNGRIYYQETIISPIRDRSGKINLFISTGRDITDKIKARRKIELLNHNQMIRDAETNRNIIASFIQGQEEERKRVSTEIHDGLCQILSIARMSVKNTKDKKCPEVFSSLDSLLESSIVEAKRISNNLSPAVLTDFGLVAGLKKLIQANGIGPQKKIVARIPDTLLRLTMQQELALFRIAQEALSNAIEHSESDTIYVRLFLSDKHLVLNVLDNGKGFIPDKTRMYTTGLGLGNIKQRARLIGAEIHINSKQNKYTSIHVKLKPTIS